MGMRILPSGGGHARGWSKRRLLSLDVKKPDFFLEIEVSAYQPVKHVSIIGPRITCCGSDGRD